MSFLRFFEFLELFQLRNYYFSIIFLKSERRSESEVSERNFLSFPGFENRKDFPALSEQIGKKSGKSFRGKTFSNTLPISI